MARCTPACIKEDFEVSHLLYIFCMSNPNNLGTTCRIYHIDGLVYDCSISIANALKILQSWYVCSSFVINIYLCRYHCIWKHEVTIWHKYSQTKLITFCWMIFSHFKYVFRDQTTLSTHGTLNINNSHLLKETKGCCRTDGWTGCHP